MVAGNFPYRCPLKSTGTARIRKFADEWWLSKALPCREDALDKLLAAGARDKHFDGPFLNLVIVDSLIALVKQHLVFPHGQETGMIFL